MTILFIGKLLLGLVGHKSLAQAFLVCLSGGGSSGSSKGTTTYGPNWAQQFFQSTLPQAEGASAAYNPNGTPLTTEGNNLLASEAAPGYTDPTQSPAFTNLVNTEQAAGNQQFQQDEGQLTGQANLAGALGSSGLEAGEAQAAQQLGTNIAQQVGQQGMTDLGQLQSIQSGVPAQAQAQQQQSLNALLSWIQNLAGLRNQTTNNQSSESASISIGG